MLFDFRISARLSTFCPREIDLVAKKNSHLFLFHVIALGHSIHLPPSIVSHVSHATTGWNVPRPVDRTATGGPADRATPRMRVGLLFMFDGLFYGSTTFSLSTAGGRLLVVGYLHKRKGNLPILCITYQKSMGLFIFNVVVCTFGRYRFVIRGKVGGQCIGCFGRNGAGQGVV